MDSRSKFELISDANALDDLIRQPGYLALLRLMQKKRHDLFSDWTQDKDLSKDFCKGALSVVDSFESDIAQTIEHGRLLQQQEQETLDLQRGRAIEGGGTGDLV